MRKARTAAATMVSSLALTVLPAFGAQGAQSPPSQSTPTPQAGAAAVPSADSAYLEPAADQTVASGPLKTQYGGGFRFTSDDGRFSLRISAGAQFRYTDMRYDREVSGNSENYSNFSLRRARLWWDGHAYSAKLTYLFHLQLEPQSAVNLHDAWITYAFRPMAQLGLGRGKIGYGLEVVSSGFASNFVDRSIFSGETDINSGGGFSKWPGGGTGNFAVSAEDANTGYPVGGLNLARSVGVQLSGRNGDQGRVFEYQAGIWQGRDTRGASNPDTGHLYSIRAGLYPNGFVNWTQSGDIGHTPTLRAGFIASAYMDRTKRKVNHAGAPVPPYDSRDHGIDLAFVSRYRGFSADVEWALETYTLDDGRLVGDREFDRTGWRAQFGYFVKPATIEAVGRYAEIERLANPTYSAVQNSGLGFAAVDDGAGGFVDAAEKKLRETTFGFNYYLAGAGHQHKIAVDYSHLTREFAGFVVGATLAGSVPEQKDDRVRAMLQLRF